MQRKKVLNDRTSDISGILFCQLVDDAKKTSPSSNRDFCVRDSSGNPFVRDEQKIGADSPTLPPYNPSAIQHRKVCVAEGERPKYYSGCIKLVTDEFPLTLQFNR